MFSNHVLYDSFVIIFGVVLPAASTQVNLRPK